MGKMKNILVDVVEFESEIKDLLLLVKDETPAVFDLMFSNSLTPIAKKRYLFRFINDREIVENAVMGIEMGLITKEMLK